MARRSRVWADCRATPSGTGQPSGSEELELAGIAARPRSPARLLPWILLRAGAIVGAGATIIAIGQIFHAGLTAGTDLAAYMRAGTAIREGGAVYAGGVATTEAFLYSPVWAILFAPISLFPGWLVQAAIMAVDVLVIRYITRSWIVTGLIGLYPITWFGLVSGNIDILIAGAIVAAWRTSSIPLAVVAFAKFAPALALDPRRLREFALTCVALVAITLPWLHLWWEYGQFLLAQPPLAGTMIPIPWFARLPIAVLLLVVRRPWASALAAVVAIPNWYLYTSLILLAPARLWWDSRRSSPATPELRWTPA